jgi:hypothetical protein
VDPEDEPAPHWPAVEGKYCSTAYQEGRIDARWLGGLLDTAGDHRVLRRAAGLEALLQNQPAEQVLYERLAEALGYKNNRLPFLQLAGLLPLAALRHAVPPDADMAMRRTMLEAAFLTAGGLMDAADSHAPDEETRAHVQALREARSDLPPDLIRICLPVEQWCFAATRPVNYPTRRLAALACLYADRLHDGLFRRLLRLVHTVKPKGRRRPDVTLRSALSGTLRVLSHPYWSRRCTFGGRQLARTTALVGSQRARSILIDVFLPMLIAHSRREEDRALLGRLHSLWEGMPRRSDNAVTRRMGQIMFGQEAEARRVVSSARRQQGLHQLYADYCGSEKGCDRCVLYLAQRAGVDFAGA